MSVVTGGGCGETARHLLLDGREPRPRAMAPRLDPAPNLLLLNGGQILECPPVATELVEDYAEPCARLREGASGVKPACWLSYPVPCWTEGQRR